VEEPDLLKDDLFRQFQGEYRFEASGRDAKG